MPNKKRNPLIDHMVRLAASPEAQNLDDKDKGVVAKLANMNPEQATQWLLENPGHPLAKGVKEVLDAVPTGRGPTMSRHQQHPEYVTQADFIAAVERRFGAIAWDLAATAKSSKGSQGFFSRDDDALTCSWERARAACKMTKKGGTIGWLNPPYGKEVKSTGIGPWMAKVYAETRASGFEVVTLTPTSTGQWFYRNVWNKADVIFLTGRLTFEGETTPYPKDCMVCRYGDRAIGGVYLWDWRTDELLPLQLQRPEAWTCGQCGKARVNVEGKLIVAPPGSLCAACVAGGKIVEATSAKVVKATKAAKSVKSKGTDKQLSLGGK